MTTNDNLTVYGGVEHSYLPRGTNEGFLPSPGLIMDGSGQVGEISVSLFNFAFETRSFCVVVAILELIM